jgi:hypothetical protein
LRVQHQECQRKDLTKLKKQVAKVLNSIVASEDGATVNLKPSLHLNAWSHGPWWLTWRCHCRDCYRSWRWCSEINGIGRKRWEANTEVSSTNPSPEQVAAS